MSSMELLWLVFLRQVKSRRLQRPSQMSRLYQRPSHVALSEKEKSDSPPKPRLTTGFGSTNTSGCSIYGQLYGSRFNDLSLGLFRIGFADHQTYFSIKT